STRREGLSDQQYKWILLLPAVLVILALTIFPLLFSLALTFTNWDLYNIDPPVFVGFDQWVRLFSDSTFLIPARNTIVFATGAVVSEFLIGLAVALALNNVTVGRTFFRLFFLLPLMVSPVATSFIMGKTMFDPSVGPIHDLLNRFGLPQIPWLTDGSWAMVTLVIVDSWGGAAFIILILTAGLQSLPLDPYEAAKVDGASELQLMRYITLPLLAPVMVTAILIRSLDAFKIVDIIATVTGGGPGNATESLTLRVYALAVKGGDVSYGAAAAYALLIIMTVFATIVLLSTRRYVRQATGEE
ncbi:MAG TPA: sugar ABC transporter permease, partial [Chloroflexota bacterium]|nr:sugar ABC transporter permease [Chloroflexota bacterium]